MDLAAIARLAGVSRSTASRVINGDRRVSPAVRARVEAIIRAHDYHPHSAARSLASRRTRIVGLLIPNPVATIFGDPFFARLIQGAIEACNAADHSLLLLMDPSADPAVADRLYRRVIRGRHLDGVVIASSVVEDPIVERLQAAAFPFVLIGRHPERAVNVVDVDNRAAARAAVAHLLAHGCRRVGLIAGPPNMIAAIDRAAGYAEALAAAGLLVATDLVVHSEFTRGGGYRAARALLDRSPPPDALFVASDTMAAGALAALQETGRRVPADMAVFGFDDLDATDGAPSDLSTVAQPIADLGHAAVDRLLHLLAAPEQPPTTRLLPTRLVLRRSCGCAIVAPAAA